MTDDTKTGFGAQPWKDGALYKFLMETFPAHRSVCQFLDVLQLARDLKKSHEAVYKWLRSSKLTPGNADAIRALAIAEPNAALLLAAGKPLPERKDFDVFVYA